MNVAELRKKYPEFVFKGYEYELKKGPPDGEAGDLHISFDFEVPASTRSLAGRGGGKIRFRPKVVIKNVSQANIKRMGEEAMENFVFHLGLAEMPSYWKATASPRIVVEAGYLSKTQINWWHDLFLKGMGQYFYENRIDFRKKDFLTIASIRASRAKTRAKTVLAHTLVPIGGGKDAIVTYEILKAARQNITPFVLNPTAVQKALLKKMGEGSGAITVQRTIDPKLLELNRKGFLNGHTPFSSYLAFLAVFCASLFGFRYIALSNERSSNEGNVEYLGKTINHQYSKSFVFEKVFRAYSKKYLAQSIEYFSFLRPLYELQIAKLFSQYPKYFATFLSCNEAHKTESGARKPADSWCCTCPKCLFVFASLYPFMKTPELLKIFGSNLFQDASLIPLMEELVGERNFKPFECVGTTKESLAAFYLCLQKTHPPLPPLLKHFRQHIALPRRARSPASLRGESGEAGKKHLSLPHDAREILHAWNRQHFLPPHLEKVLTSVVQ